MTSSPDPDHLGRNPERWRRALARLMLGMAALGCAAPAHSDDLPEYRLKAAILFNFAAFTEWPADVGGTLSVCVYGADPFGAEIDALNAKSVGTRSIVVQRKTSIDSLKSCQIVFVSNAAMGQLSRVLDGLRDVPALTVADTPGAMRMGVALNMAVVQNRIVFEANLDAARSARLNLSSKLLRLATEVIQ